MIWDQYRIPTRSEESVKDEIDKVYLKLQLTDGMTIIRDNSYSDPIFRYRIDDWNQALFKITVTGIGLNVWFSVDTIKRWQHGLMESIANNLTSGHFRTSFFVGSDGILYAKNFIQFHEGFSSDYVMENIANTLLEIYQLYWRDKVDSTDDEGSDLDDVYYYLRPSYQDEAPAGFEEICYNLPEHM